jgi:hypothetical protein
MGLALRVEAIRLWIPWIPDKRVEEMLGGGGIP